MHKRMKINGLVVFVVMLLATTVLFTACKKVDNTYVNYQPKAGNFNGNTLEYLQAQTGLYDSLLFIADRIPRLKDSLANAGVTLFAVSNRSFSLALQNINQARKDSMVPMPPVSLATIDSAVLDTFLCRYILEGRILSADISSLADGLFFPTIGYVSATGSDTAYDMQMQYVRTNASGYVGGGPASIIFSDPKGSIFHRYWVRVNTITVDIKTANSIIHLLPPGHDFGFGDEFIRAVNTR